MRFDMNEYWTEVFRLLDEMEACVNRVSEIRRKWESTDE